MFSNSPFEQQSQVISVSELNRRVRAAIEQNLPLAWVAGEMSNLRRYDSGHWYFTLKDAAAQVDCVMFRHKAQHIDWQPVDGMQVEVRAAATVYEARGKYQLNVDAMRRAGLGALYEAFEKLKAKLHELDARKPLPTDQSFSITDMATPTTNFMKRGNPKNKGPEIVPGYPRVLIKSSSEFTSSNMNRIDLARWLIRQDHPLTARVMVNRIWLNHFGSGIVSTPNDFGIKGARPTHPELLDWLATEFINSGWSIKHMHRLIVNSQTYRQASKNEDASNLAKDPGNQFLWRMNRRRLEAESLRDNMLVSSGIMNNYLFGPMVRTPLEQEVYDLIFTEHERDLFKLHGLLPPHIGTLQEQVTRRLKVMHSFGTNFERYA